MTHTVAVIDFETTGLSPDHGARVTEVAVTLIRGDTVVDRFESLMNAGAWIPPDIVALTGITNNMIARAPLVEQVMAEVDDFVGEAFLVAHNASFDRKFWDAEQARINRRRRQQFACTMLLSRRLYPAAPNHKLGTLAQFHGLSATGQHHRAMADADMAAKLYLKICHDLRHRHGISQVDHEFLIALQGLSARQVSARFAGARRASPQVVQKQAQPHVGSVEAQKRSAIAPPGRSVDGQDSWRTHGSLPKPIPREVPVPRVVNSSQSNRTPEAASRKSSWGWWIVGAVVVLLILRKC